MEFKIYKDKTAVAKAFCEHLLEIIKDKQLFHVALSGGSTPKLLFDIMAETYAGQFPWEKMHFYWGDERCVPPDDAESNYKMTVANLYSILDVPKENIHRVLGENDPTSEAMRYANLLEINLDRVEGVPQFDLVILGMGDDGHTASIFPHEIELWNSDDHCVVANHPESGQKRVSVNGKVINRAMEVAFLVTGKGKAEKVEAITQKKEGFEKYPASLVNPTSGKLLWFLDEDAAALLP